MRAVQLQYGVDSRRVVEALDEYFGSRRVDIDNLPPHVQLQSHIRSASTSGAHNRLPFGADAAAAAKAKVAACIAAGSTITWRELTAYLRDSELVGCDVSVDTVRRRLAEQGLGVLKVRSRPAIDMESQYWWRQRERYVLEMAAAWERERSGTAVVVATDESFLHNHHHRRITVCDLNDTKQVAPERRAKPRAVVPLGAGKGLMHIVCHAVTRDGLLHERTADGAYNRSASAATAEVIYAAGKGERTDRHNHHTKWNSASFLQWVRAQLIPTFQRVYGTDKAMVLLLDNSRNHSRRPSTFTKLSSPKAQLAATLEAHGVFTFTVDRGETKLPATRAGIGRRGKPATPALPERTVRDIRTFHASEWGVNAPAGPSVKELQLRLKQLYADRPELIRSQLEQMFLDGVCSLIPCTHHSHLLVCLVHATDQTRQ